jgi:hypothetical protein
VLTLLFRFTYGATQAVKRGLALGFDVDFEPALWWQRKPKKLEPVAAKAKLREVAKVIAEKAQEQAERREPVAQRKAEVREAVAPLVAEMPGYDWRPMYAEAYDRALSRLIAQQLDAQDKARKQAAIEATRRRRMDDEEISLLLALI